MNENKRERKDLESQLAEMRKKTRDHDDRTRTLDAWLKQLIDEIKLQLPADTESMDLDSTPSSLQFTDQKDFEQHLASHATNIQSLVDRLASRSKDFSPDVSELHEKVVKLLAAEKEHLSELGKLRAETSDLDERLQNASLRYMVAEKKLDRARSLTAAKLDKGLLLGGVNAGKDDANNKRDDAQTNGVSEHTEDTAELEAEKLRLTTVKAKQQEQIAKLESENAQLTAKVTEVVSKSSKVSDEDYAKTELYKQLRAQHDDAVRKLNELESLMTQLRDENSKAQTDRTLFQQQLENESRTAVAEKESALNQSQIDLVRVRNNRDELLADQAVKKASLDERTDSLKKSKELISAQEERIKALESENARLALESTNAMAASSELDSMGVEDLKTKVQELEKKLHMLTGELTSMSSAYTKAQRLATTKVTEYSSLEEKVSRSAAEKAKAEQKYFAAMKSKETKDLEIRSLRQQATKSSDMITQLKETEASSRNLLANLEKQLTEVKLALHSKTTEHQAIVRQHTSQSSDIARLNAQITELKDALSSKDAKASITASACRAAELELESVKAALAGTQKSLSSWKTKSGQAEEHEILRQLVYCTVCRKELKDTVIKTCNHTFCHGCVDKVVQLRSRKCPNCGKPFGNNDHQRIIL